MTEAEGAPARGFAVIATIVAICALAAFADGFDIAALGLAIPLMAREMNVPASEFSLSATMSVAGMAIGAMALSPLADRHGRAQVLIAMLVLVGLTSAGLMLSRTPFEVAVWRFFSGLGIGAVVPVAITLSSIFAPAARRTLLVTLVVSSTGIGVFAAGLLGGVDKLVDVSLFG